MPSGFLFLHNKGLGIDLLNFFILPLLQTKTIFIMRNLTLLKLLFALAFICKLANVGQFATASWYLIILPLILHYLVAFSLWLGKITNVQKMIDDEVIYRKAKRQIKRNDDLIQDALQEIKKDLKNGN